MQDVFTEDGLGCLWGELVQDGEMATAGLSNKDKREEGRHSVTARRSQFNHFLQEWTWGQVRGNYIHLLTRVAGTFRISCGYHCIIIVSTGADS